MPRAPRLVTTRHQVWCRLIFVAMSTRSNKRHKAYMLVTGLKSLARRLTWRRRWNTRRGWKFNFFTTLKTFVFHSVGLYSQMILSLFFSRLKRLFDCRGDPHLSSCFRRRENIARLLNIFRRAVRRLGLCLLEAALGQQHAVQRCILVAYFWLIVSSRDERLNTAKMIVKAIYWDDKNAHGFPSFSYKCKWITGKPWTKRNFNFVRVHVCKEDTCI